MNLDQYKMPAVAPRAHEIAELAEALERDEFDSAKQMARKAISLALHALSRRTWYAIAVHDGGGATPYGIYGMFATEGAAMKAIESNTLALVGRATVLEIQGIGARSDYLLAQEGLIERPCGNCNHAEPAHRWPRARRPGCIVGNCGCREYVVPPREIEEALIA